jgi:hypothetical protein
MEHVHEHGDHEAPDNEEVSDESASVDGKDNTYDDEVRSQIEDDDPNFMSLLVGYQHFVPSDGDWAGLGRAMGRNTHLKEICVFLSREINFWPCPMSKEDFIHLFCGLASNQSIQKLKLVDDIPASYAIIDDEMANIIANGLIQNATLKELEMVSYSTEMTRIGWLAIFTSL